MIKFFRRIRHRLLSENKIKNYLLYAIGEIILVVIGILIALQVNNRNENRKEHVIEVELLKGLKKEMMNNKIQMVNVLESHKRNLAASQTIMNLFGMDVRQISTITIDTLFSDLYGTWTYNPRMGKIKSIISSGKLDYLRNDDLKSYLASFEDDALDASELSIKVNELRFYRLNDILDKFISRKNRLNITLNDSTIPRSSFQSNYDAVFNSLEVENIISNIWAYYKFGLLEEEEHLAAIDSILFIIDHELKNDQ